MGLKFHDGTHKLYKTYTNAKAWNDTALLRNPPAWMLTWNTEGNIAQILKNNKSKLSYKERVRVVSSKTGRPENREVVHNLLDLVSSDHADVNLWMLKGLHQQNDPHLTVGFDGFLLHLGVQTRRLAPGRFEAFITSISKGDWGTQEDADGFTKV